MGISRREYVRFDVAAFERTRDEFGFFSNFAYSPLYFGNLIVPTAEHFYQLQKFENEAVRSQIALARTPFDAKQLARAHMKAYGYADWTARSIDAMRATLRAKEQQHSREIRALFVKSGERQIVEVSRFDAFWGAKSEGHLLVGCNVLGRLLMELRDRLR